MKSKEIPAHQKGKKGRKKKLNLNKWNKPEGKKQNK